MKQHKNHVRPKNANKQINKELFRESHAKGEGQSHCRRTRQAGRTKFATVKSTGSLASDRKVWDLFVAKLHIQVFLELLNDLLKILPAKSIEGTDYCKGKCFFCAHADPSSRRRSLNLFGASIGSYFFLWNPYRARHDSNV